MLMTALPKCTAIQTATQSALRDLAQLKELLDVTRTERGPAYTAATIVFLDKLSTIDLYLDGEPE